MYVCMYVCMYVYVYVYIYIYIYTYTHNERLLPVGLPDLLRARRAADVEQLVEVLRYSILIVIVIVIVICIVTVIVIVLVQHSIL